MSPAQEANNRVAESNAKRMQELFEQIKAAGVAEQFVEFMKIQDTPNKAYTERVA